MSKTTIEWTQFTWNPVHGCTPISAGCKNCYARRMARRLQGRYGYPPAPDYFNVTLRPDRLEEPLKRKKPTRYFVVSMGDLFHEDVPDTFIANVISRMDDAQQHTYQILTKRSARMRELFSRPSWRDDYTGWHFTERKNWWFGVTVENQATADERRADFEATPAAVKFVSYEPALGPVDWTGWEFVDQIITGGETGPGARPAHPQWFRDTRDFCQSAGVSYFHKQNGEYITEQYYMTQTGSRLIPIRLMKHDGFVRVGKSRAGRHLDGRTWDEMPGMTE